MFDVRVPFRIAAEDLSLRTKLLFVCLLPMILGLVVGCSLLCMLKISDIEASKALHAKEVAKMDAVLVQDLCTSSLAVSSSSVPSMPISNRYEMSKQQTHRDMQSLLELVAEDDDVSELKLVRTLEQLIIRLFQQGDYALKVAIVEGKATFPLEALDAKLRLEKTFQEILHVNSLLARKISEQLRHTDPSNQTFRTVIEDCVIGLMLSMILLSLALWKFTSHALTRRVLQLVRTTHAAPRGEQLPPLLSGSDEMASLDRFIRDMFLQLDETYKREQSVLQNAGDAICSIERTGMITLANRAATALWKRPLEDVVGSNIMSFMDPKDKPTLSTQLATLRPSDGAVTVETTAMNRDQFPRALLASITAEQNSDRLFCVIHDITERKRAEEATRESEQNLQTIMESLPIGLVVLKDPIPTIEFANATFQGMVDRPLDTLVDTSLSALFDDAKQMLQYEGHTSIKSLFLRKADSTTISVDLIFSRINLARQERTLVIARDVSARDELEDLKQQFVSMVSHDLRSPLTSLRCMLDMLQTGTYGELTQPAMQMIKDSDEALAGLMHLVNELLLYEKLVSGEFDLDVSAHRTEQAIEQAIVAIKPLAFSKKIELINSSPSTVVAYFDHERIVQVMINLLSNAIKFSPAQSCITIDTAVQAAFVRISVCDRGQGIPEARQALIFQPYKPLHQHPSKEEAGFGIGLPICKLIVERHGGQIGVVSEEENGSTFWFTLPLQLRTITSSPDVSTSMPDAGP